MGEEIEAFLDEYEKTYVVTHIDGNWEAWTFLAWFEEYPNMSNVRDFLEKQYVGYEEEDYVSFFPIVDVMPLPKRPAGYVFRVLVEKEHHEQFTFEFEFETAEVTPEMILERIGKEDIGYDDRYGKFEFYLVN